MLLQITEMSRDVPDVVPGGVIETVVPKHRPCAISLAHCGSVGVGWLLLTEVLGIAPRGPGFDGCLISPRIDLLPKAAGTFPSSRGDISVEWETIGSSVTLAATLPPDTAGELRLPSGAAHALRAGARTHITVAVTAP